MKCLLIAIVGLSLLGGLKAQLDLGLVKFYLSSHVYDTIPVDQNNVTSVLEEGVEELVFLIHGWMDSAQADWYEELAEAFLAQKDRIYNVIKVDWSIIAATPYPTAVIGTVEVASVVGDFILEVTFNSTLNASAIHIAGHSLGAQIAGLIGGNLTTEIDSKLGRITGLDPAGPSYVGLPPSLRLDETDAEIVLVIHTDGLDNGYLGTCGTSDFYPNGGVAPQPGCPDLTTGDIVDCDHKRSYRFFIDALNNPGTFIGTQCANYITFQLGACKGKKEIDAGVDITTSDSGVFYLTTNPRPTYGEGA